MLRLLRGRVGDRLTLVGVGGITTVADARARLDAGADLLQGYTAFIYEGPGWPRRIHQGSLSDPSEPGSPPPSRPAARCAPASTRTPGLLAEWGLPDDVAGLERFALTAVEGLAPHVAVVKPQSAFYERFGSRGVAVLERVIAESRAAGALVLLDVKRGDIGSTTQAYADAYLDPASPLAADAITASPYLGFGSLEPMVDTARKHDAGLFVLALTSNKEGPEVQHAVTEDGQTVAGRMLDHLRAAQRTGPSRWAPSVRSSAPRSARARSTSTFNGPILAPGFGAQGGTVADLRRIFGTAVAAVTPSSSRELLRRGPSVEAMRDEALRLNDELGRRAAVRSGPGGEPSNRRQAAVRRPGVSRRCQRPPSGPRARSGHAAAAAVARPGTARGRLLQDHRRELLRRGQGPPAGARPDPR